MATLSAMFISNISTVWHIHIHVLIKKGPLPLTTLYKNTKLQ